MKKKITFLALLALCTALLAGCGCEHEWIEADCLAPKTCSLCSEIEGEPLGHQWIDATCITPKTCSGCGMPQGDALGHSWQDAVCESPKTCTVCAATEGESLGHSYSKWAAEGETMYRSCSSCGRDESRDTDRAVLLNDLLLGRWDCSEVIFGEFDMDPEYQFRGPIPYMVIEEDNALHFFNGSQHFDGTISFVEYARENETDMYIFLGMQDDTPQLAFQLDISSEGEGTLYAYLSYYTLKFSLESEQTAAMRQALVGSWISTEKEVYEDSGILREASADYTVTFRDDHSFTASMDGQELTGMWLDPELRETEDFTEYVYTMMYLNDHHWDWSHVFLFYYHNDEYGVEREFKINFDNVLMVYYEPA